MIRLTKKFLSINVGIYRLHVIVTWETTPAEISRYSKQHGVPVAKNFEKEFTENTKDAIGLCMELVKGNPDVLVWLAKQPKRATSYGTLYHELYHAVDSISDSRNLGDELEARAYLYEYLVTEANKFFWSRR